MTELAPPAVLDESGAAARRRVVSLLTAFVFAGTFASVVWHYFEGQYRLKGYPSNTFLFWPHDHFGDFFEVYRNAQHFVSAGQENLVYSPMLHLFTKVMTVFPDKLAFALIVAAFLATVAAVVWYWLTPDFGGPLQRLPQALVLTLFTYPVLFALDRGNLEMVVFVLLAAFFYLYYAVHSRWAWLPLALAIAWSSGVGIGKVLSIWGSTLGGHLDMSNTLFTAHHGHSLWGVVQLIDRWSGGEIQMWLAGRSSLRRLYVVACLLAFLWICGRLLTHEHADWQGATVLVVCALLLPMENHDYTLIQLFLPLALFVRAAGRVRRWWLVALLFALPLVPADYVHFSFSFQYLWLKDVSTSVLVYPAALLALLVVALRGEYA